VVNDADSRSEKMLTLLNMAHPPGGAGLARPHQPVRGRQERAKWLLTRPAVQPNATESVESRRIVAIGTLTACTSAPYGPRVDASRDAEAQHFVATALTFTPHLAVGESWSRRRCC
jgi:hypothetical protein